MHQMAISPPTYINKAPFRLKGNVPPWLKRYVDLIGMPPGIDFAWFPYLE